MKHFKPRLVRLVLKAPCERNRDISLGRLVIYVEDVASLPNETFIYKVALTIVTLKLHCAIVTFHFNRGACGTP